MRRTDRKLAIGAALACIGALAILLMLLIDPRIDRPWGFLVGFGAGLTSALGAGFCLVGWIGRRRVRDSQ